MKDFWRIKKILRSIIACAVCLFVITSCDDGNDEDQPDNASPRVIGPAGGVVEVTDPASPVYGAAVVIPPNALAQDTVISIEPVDLPAPLPAGYGAAGGCISFKPDGCVFSASVDITLPYNDRNDDGILDNTDLPESKAEGFYYNESKKNWEQIAIASRDTKKNSITAGTDHFSTYLVPVNTGSETTGGEDTTNTIAAGEYFVGTPQYRFHADGSKELIPLGCLDQDQQACYKNDTCRQCGTPYVLTVRAEITDNGTVLIAVIDKFATSAGGYPVTINSEGACASFDVTDPSDYFPLEKVRSSGSAETWEWRCEYVVPWVELNGYKACSDDSQIAICDASNGKKYCTITASGATVTICFGIALSDSVNSSGIPQPNVAIGNFGMLPIAFEGWYKGP